MKASAGLPRRRWARRLAFAAIALLLVVGVLEVGGAVAWWIATGSPFTWGRAATARELARTGSLAEAADATAADVATAQRATNRDVVVHPYFGFVYNQGGAPGTPLPPISAYGFVDAGSPLRPAAADTYVVAVVGGSVAMQFAYYAGDRFAAALARSPMLAGKHVELVPLAVGGYKQPQQLLVIATLLALGGHFDCVVNLDGFNEVALAEENVPHGVPAWYPRSWARLLDSVPLPEQQLRLGRLAVLREQRRDAVAFADRLWWSPLAQVLWWLGDRSQHERLAVLAAEVEHAAAAPSFAVTGPGTGGESLAAAQTAMVALWRRASLELDALCRAHGIAYCHFLQPNQYLPGSKPIGDVERARALRPGSPWAKAVAECYPQLQRAGTELVAAGVAFTDLSGVFHDHPEPLYVDDCCHFGPAGNLILAEFVAAGVRRRLERDRPAPVALVARPDHLVLTSPLWQRALQLVGRDAEGGETEVGSVASGIEYTVEPADSLEVGVDGGIRAIRRGAGVLTARLGALQVAVPFTARWPDAFVAADAIAPPGGVAPRLDVERVPGEPAGTAHCRDLPDAPMRILVAGGAPLPDVLREQDLGALQIVPLAPGAEASVPVAVPPRPGLPLFVRAYALASDPLRVVAATANVVLTVD